MLCNAFVHCVCAKRGVAGTIMKRNRDNTYWVKYSDGDEEKSVDAALIRRVASVAAAKPQSSSRMSSAADSDTDDRAKLYAVGDDIEADFKGMLCTALCVVYAYVTTCMLTALRCRSCAVRASACGHCYS
jgi:hypothetical protein